VPQAGGFGNSEDFAMQMMGSLFGSMLAGMLAPPQQDASYQQQQILKQKIEKQKQEALKKQAAERWKKLKKEEMARLTGEEARKKERGSQALAKMGRTGSGKLEPFKWDTPKLEAKPIGAGIYDTSGYTSWQRMLCAAYFSSKAINASRSGEVDSAAFMNAQANKVTDGEMTDVECRLPALQSIADIQRQSFKENTRLTKMVKLMPTIQEEVGYLQQIEMKLYEVKKEKKEAETTLKKVAEKVDGAKVQVESAQTQEEKSEADDLLKQALALQDEASVQLEEAKQAEAEYTKLKDQSLGELKNLREKLNSGSEN
jgi:hypothetical protein